MDMTCTDVDLFLKKLTFTLLCKRERERDRFAEWGKDEERERNALRFGLV